MHLVPIFPVHLESFNEPKMFLICPSAIIFIVRRIVIVVLNLLLGTIGIGMVLGRVRKLVYFKCLMTLRTFGT